MFRFSHLFSTQLYFWYSKGRNNDIDHRDEENQNRYPIVNTVGFAYIVSIFDIILKVDGQENSNYNLQKNAEWNKCETNKEYWMVCHEIANDVLNLIHICD